MVVFAFVLAILVFSVSLFSLGLSFSFIFDSLVIRAKMKKMDKLSPSYCGEYCKIKEEIEILRFWREFLKFPIIFGVAIDVLLIIIGITIILIN